MKKLSLNKSAIFANSNPNIKHHILKYSNPFFSEIGPGWNIAFAADFAEFYFYRLSQFASLSDQRKYWIGGKAGLGTSYTVDTIPGKVKYLN